MTVRSKPLGVVVPLDEGKRKSGASIAPLVQLTRKAMERVNVLILSRAGSDVSMIPEVARHLIDSGGKRLRPMLTLAAAEMCSYEGESHIKLAASVEFMHTATLLHDDVVDESELRRGKPSARMVWGNQASVLVGDFLLGQAFMMMVETRDIGALGVLARAAAIMAEGEVFQLAKTRDLATSAAEYEEVIRAKTAMLFEAAAEVGAMTGGADAAGREALKTYGAELGLAFQLVDDVLDYRGESDTLGKNNGDDLREGKMTLPIILALEAASPAEQQVIEGALGDAAVPDATLREVLAILERHDTLGRTIDQAQAHARAAREALRVLPASEMRTLLGDVAEFSVARGF
jgi:octaprenyl-diphosphate synthase